MRNLITPILVIILSISGLNSQTDIGIKASVGISNSISESKYATKQSDNILYMINSLGSDKNYSIGLFVNKKAGNIFLQGNALVSRFSNTYDIQSFISDDILSGTRSETTVQLDVPLLMGVAINNFRLGVGPQLQYELHRSSELIGLPEFDDRGSKFSTGFNVSLGYDLGPIYTDLSLYNSFTAKGQGIYLNNEIGGFKARDRQIKFSIGLKF
jgi:hypothetical protein